ADFLDAERANGRHYQQITFGNGAVEPLHDLTSMDDRTVPLLVVGDVAARVDGDDPIADRPAGPGRLPDSGKVEEIAAVEGGAIPLLADRHVELRGRDQAAIAFEGLSFGANKPVVYAVAEPWVGTPDCLDHLDFRGIVGVAPNDRSPVAQ